jgi:hypothetical protein
VLHSRRVYRQICTRLEFCSQSYEADFTSHVKRCAWAEGKRYEAGFLFWAPGIQPERFNVAIFLAASSLARVFGYERMISS